MSKKTLALSLLLLVLPVCFCLAQADSLAALLQEIPKKYLHAIEQKADKYSARMVGKTEKTLVKLSKWETKIQTLLLKVNPDAANRLFGNNQLTFTAALEKFRQGKTISDGYVASYDQYRDELTTQVKYLAEKKDELEKKYHQAIEKSSKTVSQLEENIRNTESVQQFIKERRKMLISEAFKHLGKSKYLQKINKESFYYTETLRNYKEVFKDKKKAEETAVTLLNKIPAFRKFVRENGMLASLFRTPDNGGGGQGLVGLQTRASVNSLIQTRMGSGGANAQALVQQNMQAAQAQLSALKDKLLKSGSVGGDSEMPSFKPNMQKTKTFAQRIEYGFDFQSVKSNSFMPAGASIGLSIGYKINDKSVAGLGMSYRMGMGSIEKIRFTHEGIGLRSFMDWKLKKQLFISGGFEMNHNASFKNITVLQQADSWQQSGLIGISKKINVKSKLMKGTKLQLMYDLLYRQHSAVSQPVIFRVGYNF